MLDELRDLFLTALKFEGDNAMPLVNQWNEAVKRVQAVFDSMTSKIGDAVPVRVIQGVPAADVVEVVRCHECILHDICSTEDVFKFARLNDDRRFCGVGKRKGGDE